MEPKQQHLEDMAGFLSRHGEAQRESRKLFNEKLITIVWATIGGIVCAIIGRKLNAPHSLEWFCISAALLTCGLLLTLANIFFHPWLIQADPVPVMEKSAKQIYADGERIFVRITMAQWFLLAIGLVTFMVGAFFEFKEYHESLNSPDMKPSPHSASKSFLLQ